MLNRKFARLVRLEILTADELNKLDEKSRASGSYAEELLIEKGIPKHEVLFSLAEYYGLPFAEYEESVTASYFLTMRLDMEKLKRGLWFPLSVMENSAEVIAYNPDDPLTVADIKRTLGVERIRFIVALPSDLIRIIEHNFDVNPHFPHPAGRTPLAKVRTFLADRRSLMAYVRTSLAKGRTGLAFIRTGVSFMAIAIALLRVFGIGYFSIFETVLFVSGLIMTVDGVVWYLPARKAGGRKLYCSPTEATWGTTVLEVSNPGNDPVFSRTGPAEGADTLRSGWNNLSPVMRRRFLASDRTDFAEERTTLACYRTIMARARTGLAFTRTGIAFIGLGIAFLRQFRTGPWTVFDVILLMTGVTMAMEGLYWYFPGRRAGRDGFGSVLTAQTKQNIWDLAFPPEHKKPESVDLYASCPLPVKGTHSPGVWATTGLALERTLLAERRNVMARLRTVMARSRTGMAFIRTGISLSSVGLGLLLYFGTANLPWTLFDSVLVLAGLASIADGLYWHLPAERIRKQFPYCFGDMEISIPDYGVPCRNWKKAVFSSD